MITASLVLVLVAIWMRDLSLPDKYVVDKGGNVVGIIKDNSNNSEFELTLTLINGDELDVRDVVIRNRMQSSNGQKEGVSDEELKEAKREVELSNLLNDIELSSKKKQLLPTSLTDGTKLKWTISEQKSNDALIIIMIYLILLGLITRSAISPVKEDLSKQRESILRSLPRFTNQLLLMMNAGVILSDAFSNICSNYAMINAEERDFFEEQMITIESNNKNHRDSTARLLTDFAARYNIKEMMRIATILMENEKRGSDVIDNLERESEFLWDNRKITASERGKALDAKMAYPLGLLLIILIIITIAPAFLTM